MRIVIDPSDYNLGFNLGDVAMTRVAATRLSALWPEARIDMLVYSPTALPLVCPTATAVSIAQPSMEPKSSWLHSVVSKIPKAVRRSIVRSELKTRLRKLVRGASSLPRREYKPGQLATLSSADLMVVAGMGSVTDAFTGYALDMLGRIEFALDAGVPVVMVGQGIGPIDDLILRQRAAEILRRVSFISLREGRAGPQLLHALGVSSERVMVTGDDAIELAFESRAAELGRGLGVNLRTADYAQLRSGMVDQFRPIVQDAAQKYSAPLISIPIDGDDLSATTRLLSGYGESAEITAFVNDPQAAFEQVKSCRATMTGSYHAAVFSLSLGTPAVCVAASAYYADKFLGLAEQFGQGCEVVLLRKHDWPKLLAEALDRTWYSADRVRPKLLARAQNQIALGHAAYQRIHSLIESNVRFVGAHNL